MNISSAFESDLLPTFIGLLCSPAATSISLNAFCVDDESDTKSAARPTSLPTLVPAFNPLISSNSESTFPFIFLVEDSFKLPPTMLIRLKFFILFLYFIHHHMFLVFLCYLQNIFQETIGHQYFHYLVLFLFDMYRMLLPEPQHSQLVVRHYLLFLHLKPF